VTSGAGRVLALVALAGACLVTGAQAIVPAAKAPAATTLKVPRIDYRERKLGNGLVLLSVESHTSPTVSVQVWYRVGGSDDPAGRSGFAHLFEHMMFKSTTYLKAEQFDRMTEDVGGSNNASTSDDVTAYEEVVPSNHLETLLWAEAERMQNLQVDEANFKSERAVVEEEYRQRILASPYGRFFNAVRSAPYLQHPYRRPTIGNIDDLEAATLADVAAFHATYYRPDNATLVVTGDFEPRQLDAWVDKYFATIAHPAAPLPRRDASEPAWTSDRTLTVKAPRVPLPAVAAVWLAPPVTSPDAPALQVAAALLSAGESSRLNQSLVYRQQIATQAGFSADLRVGPGLLIASAIAAGGKPITDVQRALLAEVQRLVDRPATQAEIDKVKNQLITDAFESRQTPVGLGSAIAEAAVLEGDANKVNTDLDALQRVSAADVQRVLRRYVTQAHKVIVDYRQETAP
jgi:zinc protease